MLGLNSHVRDVSASGAAPGWEDGMFLSAILAGKARDVIVVAPTDTLRDVARTLSVRTREDQKVYCQEVQLIHDRDWSNPPR